MKYLDKNGLVHFWSNVKGWAMDNIVPLTRKINGKDLSSDITLRAKDIPYESSNVSDTMKDVRNVMLEGDTCTDNVYSNSAGWSIRAMDTGYASTTAPASDTTIFRIRVSENNNNFAAVETKVLTDNTISAKAMIYDKNGTSSYLEQKADYSSGEGYLNTNANDIYIGTKSDAAVCGETENGTHIHLDGSSSYIKFRREGTNGPYISMGYSGTGFSTTLQYGAATKNRVLKFPDISGGTLQLRDKRNFTVTDPNGVFTIEKAYYVGPLFFIYGYLDYTKPTTANNRVYTSGTKLLDGIIDPYVTGISFVPNSSNYKCILRGRLHSTSSNGTFMVKTDVALTANQYFYIYGMLKPTV